MMVLKCSLCGDLVLNEYLMRVHLMEKHAIPRGIAIRIAQQIAKGEESQDSIVDQLLAAIQKMR